jgi:hypothetical protein
MEEVERECAICFIELPALSDKAFLPCGCGDFCSPCTRMVRDQCPLCRTPINMEPEPMLLRFLFINGKTLEMTCHPDQTLAEITAAWPASIAYKFCYARTHLDRNKQLSLLPLVSGAKILAMYSAKAD